MRALQKASGQGFLAPKEDTEGIINITPLCSWIILCLVFCLEKVTTITGPQVNHQQRTGPCPVETELERHRALDAGLSQLTVSGLSCPILGFSEITNFLIV